MATETKKTRPKKRRESTPFSALTDEDSFLGPGFLRKIGRGASDWVEGEFGPRNAPPESLEPLETESDLPSGGSADDTEENVAAARRQISILADPSFTENDRRKVASNLSGASYDVLNKAAAGAGLDVQDVLASMDQLVPKSANRVLLARKGKSISVDTNQPTPQEVLTDQIAEVVSETPAPKPSKNNRNQDIDALRSRQAQFPTGENIAREAARNRPLDSFTRAEQFLEDMDSVGGPVRRPEDVRAPKATYAGAAKPVGPGGKDAGTQEDFESYRAEKAIDDAVAERNRQQRIKFLRAGGRMAADGKNIAVLPGRAPETVTLKDGRKVKPSGAFAYADDLREEARLAENQRNKESSDKFRDKLETDRTRRAEAEEFLSSMKSQIRATENTARGLERGNVRGGSAENLSSFFDDLDKTRAVKAQIRDKSKDQQVAWARGVLDARREEQKRVQEEEDEKRKRVAQASFQDIVTNRRNQPTYLGRY